MFKMKLVIFLYNPFLIVDLNFFNDATIILPLKFKCHL